MDFSYSAEQREVIELADKILADFTSNEQLRRIDQQPQRFDPALWQAMAQAGLLGVAIDEAYGGMGMGYETLCLVAEAVGRYVAPVPVVPVLASAALLLQRCADEATRARLLPSVASGDQLLSAALVEPASEDPCQPQTRATQTAEGWQLQGCKHSVPFAADAAAIVLTANSDEGLGVFLLEAANFDSDAVTLLSQQVTAGEPQYQLQLDGAPVQCLVLGDDAEAAATYLYEITAAAYAAMATGLCDAMLKMTASYTSERHQFGVPVATFQAVGQRAADAFIDIECQRLVTQQAVSRLDQGLEASEAVLSAKIWTGDVCHRVSQSAQHLHGGMGVDRDYPLFRYCLWARQIELTAGASAALNARLGQQLAAGFIAEAGAEPA